MKYFLFILAGLLFWLGIISYPALELAGMDNDKAFQLGMIAMPTGYFFGILCAVIAMVKFKI